MPVTVWPVDWKSRRTLPTHEHAAAARIRENPRGELLVFGPEPEDALGLDRGGSLTASEDEVPPLATYSKGAWYRAVVTDANGEVVDEIGVTS